MPSCRIRSGRSARPTRGCLAVDGRPRLYLTIQTWGHLAGRCAQHLTTGRHVAITASMRRDQWITRAGERADRWYARANDVTFLDTPADARDDTRDDDAADDGSER